MTQLNTLFDRFVAAGGFMMIFIVPAAIMTVAYSIQGFVNLRAARTAPRDMADTLWKARKEGGEEAVTNLLNDQDNALARILRRVRAAVDATPGVDPTVLLREQIAEECDRLLHENSQLGLIYRIGPLMGLVGTVVGMIKAFTQFSLSTQPELQQLATGVMVALTTTAWGIGMAFPAFFFLFRHQNRITFLECYVFPDEGELCLHAILGRPVGSSLELARTRNLT